MVPEKTANKFRDNGTCGCAISGLYCQDDFFFYFILMVTLLKVFKGNVIERVLVSEVTEF